MPAVHQEADVWWTRHAETTGNAGLPTESSATTPLTSRGLAQARAWAAACPEAPGLIVSSRYQRARDTAEPLRRAFPGSRYEEWPVHEFTYLDEDRYRGTTVSERRGAVDAYWARNDPDHRDGPAAETFGEFMTRVARALDGLAPEPFTVVFTHEHVIRAVAWLVLSGVRTFDREAMRAFASFRAVLCVPNLATLPMRRREKILYLTGLRRGCP